MLERKQFKFLLIGLTLVLITGLSCNRLVFREIQCRKANHASHLEWFAGELNDKIELVKPDSNLITFLVDDKYIFHTTQYTSDTGCSCNDLWGIRMVAGPDTISIYNQEKYIEDNDSNISNLCYVTINGQTSGFITEDRSVLNTLTINDITLSDVVKFEYPHSADNQFTEVYIAKNIGIVQMVNAKGEYWINKNLTTTLNTNLDSFKYEENTCE